MRRPQRAPWSFAPREVKVQGTRKRALTRHQTGHCQLVSNASSDYGFGPSLQPPGTQEPASSASPTARSMLGFGTPPSKNNDSLGFIMKLICGCMLPIFIIIETQFSKDCSSRVHCRARLLGRAHSSSLSSLEKWGAPGPPEPLSLAHTVRCVCAGVSEVPET